MADKMMRIAGRNEKGLAKPFKIAKNGGLSVEKTERFLMEEYGSSARTILAGGSWESEVFHSGGLSDLSFYTTLNMAADYTLELVEMVSDGSNYYTKETITLLPSYLKGSTNGRIEVSSPFFKLVIKNLGLTQFNCGLYLYMK